MTDCPAALNLNGQHIPCTEGERGHGVTTDGFPAHANPEYHAQWIGDEPGRLPEVDDLVIIEEPITVDELWDATPGPEITADYVPALDGTAAVTGPSDAHPELRLAREGYGDLEARLTAIIGGVDGEAYVSRIVSALIAAGVRFEHSDV